MRNEKNTVSPDAKHLKIKSPFLDAIRRRRDASLRRDALLYAPVGQSVKKTMMFGEIWHRFKKNKSAIIGLYIFICILIIMILGPLFLSEEGVTAMDVRSQYLAPCWEHLLGTDRYGRDVLTRLIFGGRTTILTALCCSVLGFLIGGSIGLSASYYGKKVDIVLMRILDVVSAMPAILLAMVLVASFGPSIRNLIIALAVSRIPPAGRVVRSAVLSVANSDYVKAARAAGTKDLRIMVKHITPNVMGTMTVLFTTGWSRQILDISALSYLGLGVQPPTPEWGYMLSEARGVMRTHPQFMMYPGVLILLATLSLCLVGDGLRDAFDPRLRD